MKKLEKRQFGVDEFGFTLIPSKFSNVKVSRIYNTDKTGGCSYCFPHGIECNNSSHRNSERNWKSHRNNQWRG